MIRKLTRFDAADVMGQIKTKHPATPSRKKLVASGELPMHTLCPDTVDFWREEFRNERPLFIEGVACLGKTTLISNLLVARYGDNIQPQKVNFFLNVKDYNFDSQTALQYLSKMILINRKHKLIILDRSAISNIAFQYAHNLMNYMNDTSMSKFMRCELFTDTYRLGSTLEMIKAQKLNVVILIDTNFLRVAEAMRRRNQRGDSFKGHVLDYVQAQTYAFIYLASKLNYPVLNQTDEPIESERYNYTHAMIKPLFDVKFETSAEKDVSDPDHGYNTRSKKQKMSEPVESRKTKALNDWSYDIEFDVKRSDSGVEEMKDRLVGMRFNRR